MLNFSLYSARLSISIISKLDLVALTHWWMISFPKGHSRLTTLHISKVKFMLVEMILLRLSAYFLPRLKIANHYFRISFVRDKQVWVWSFLAFLLLIQEKINQLKLTKYLVAFTRNPFLLWKARYKTLKKS